MTAQNKPSIFNDPTQPGLAGARNIIAIASGKGGVGKSTVAVNLAMALKLAGARVGLMDADIYGPSQPGMLGSRDTKPDISNGYLKPITKHGINFISMGLLVDNNSPVIWRAPMAMKMIHQFISSVAWGELDYLLIDLPPGTGDVQLTLAQQASLTGAIIVTTPQQVALDVARKGLCMFEQVNVPIIGIIENMSGFTCKHCNKVTAVFKEGGGQKMAKDLKVPYLGSIPLDPEIMMSGDNGSPVANQGNDSLAAQSFRKVAEEVKRNSEKISKAIKENEPQEIQISSDGNLTLLWHNGHESIYTPYHLRANCPCASCIDEDSGKKILDTNKIPLDIKIDGVNTVGRYGLSVSFSDSHNTGIYIHNMLREICECELCTKKNKQDSFSV
ncbi:MAG: P-loop NTPase [Candidatus Zixiibacteriota bacterium]